MTQTKPTINLKNTVIDIMYIYLRIILLEQDMSQGQFLNEA